MKNSSDAYKDSEGRWACACGANMGGQYPHQYPDGKNVILCEDCIESVNQNVPDIVHPTLPPCCN